MKAKLTAVLYLFLCVFLYAEDTYSERIAVLEADSLRVTELLNSVRSDFVKNEIEELLVRISGSKKIFRPFTIDFYRRNGHSYKLSGHKEMTVSELLDTLSQNIIKAKILRINKLDLNGNGSKNAVLTDNSFKDLGKEPSYRQKDKLMNIIEETALGSNRKSSLEWIWGRSPEDDAYYSTKLTYFDDRFSLYPEYRFFVGNDPLRDRNGWFFSLSVHTGEQEIIAAQSLHETQIPLYNTGQDHNSPEDVLPAETEKFDCGPSSYGDSDYGTDIVEYTKTADGDLISSTLNMKMGDLLKVLYGRSRDIRFIRLTGTDFSFEGGEVRKSESETVIKISGDVNFCTDRIRSFLSEGMTGANRKRSAEFITGTNSDKLSYNAAIVTVYDGQTSYFHDYKIYASSEVRKNKTSWFNSF